MAQRTNGAKGAARSYMSLLRRFPLRPIRCDAYHEQAADVVGNLIGRRLDPGASDYLDILILLVNKYEDEHHTPAGLHLTPQQALRAIMEANGLTQADVGRVIGSASSVSMFLKGERELSKPQIRALVKRFRVDAALFLAGLSHAPTAARPVRPRVHGVHRAA
jgi:HTH-type transcriptional regulator / antitoxin HigA